MEVFVLTCNGAPKAVVMGSAKYAANKLNSLRVDEYETWKEHFGSFASFCKAHVWMTEKVPFFAAENSLFFDNRLP